MPYVSQKDREKYHSVKQSIDDLPLIETKGDLEYLVFVLMKKFMTSREFRYSTLHDVVYAVHHAAHEYERRNLDKREDEAREANGDI
jgi:hypothetical protein